MAKKFNPLIKSGFDYFEKSEISSINGQTGDVVVNTYTTEIIDWRTGDEKPALSNPGSLPVTGELIEGEKHLIIRLDKGILIKVINKETAGFSVESRDDVVVKVADKILVGDSSSQTIKAYRLDGSLDPDFDFYLFSAPNTVYPYGMVEDSGEVIIHGLFNSVPGVQAYKIDITGRQTDLMSFGTGSITKMKKTLGDNYYISTNWRRHDNIVHMIAKISNSLSLDNDFHCNIGNDGVGSVQDIIVLPSGKLYAHGTFTEGFVLINTDGSIDSSFNPAITDFERATLGLNGRILLYGSATADFIELNEDGSIYNQWNIDWGAYSPATLIQKIDAVDNSVFLSSYNGNVAKLDYSGNVRSSFNQQPLELKLFDLTENTFYAQIYEAATNSYYVVSFDLTTGEAVSYSDQGDYLLNLIRGANQTIITDSYDQLEAVTTGKNAWYGVTYPADGSDQCAYTGDAEWSTSHPWRDDVAMVLLTDDFQETVIATPDNPVIDVGADLTGASGQVMVRFKAFYHRQITDEAGAIIERRWSPTALPGFELHPFFTDGIREADWAYISAYEASNMAGNILGSAFGLAPLTTVTAETFNARAVARGDGWHDYDWAAQDLIELLFDLFYGNINSQNVLPGYTQASAYNSAYKRLTGRSNILTTVNGSIPVDLTGTDADLTGIVAEGNMIANRFMFIENPFGHIWKIMSRISYDGRVAGDSSVWLTKNPAVAAYTDAQILSNLEKQIYKAAPTDGYIKRIAQFGTPIFTGGSSSTYFGDYFYSLLDDAARDYFRLVRAGGDLTTSLPAGLRSRYSNYGLGLANSSIGSRLCAKKYKVQ